jgi:hypothetical protein
MANDEVKVEQCDREAAADIVSGILSELTCEHIRRGLYDGDHMVQRVAEVRRLQSVAARPAPAEDAVERVAQALEDDPFCDDLPFLGTTQQRLRCEHYARAALAAMQPRGEQQAGRYLVWSNEHQAWWGPDHRGYTRYITRAGRYSRDDALSIAGTRDGGWHVRKGNPDEIAIPEQDAIDQYSAITAAQEPLP